MTDKRMVVFGADQKQYLCKVDGEGLRALEDMTGALLKDVYQLLTLDQHIVDPRTQQASGISRGYMLMNIGTAEGALPELHLYPVGWFDPEACGVLENLERLVAQVEKSVEDRKGRSSPRVVAVGPDALQQLDQVPSLRDAFKNK